MSKWRRYNVAEALNLIQMENYDNRSDLSSSEDTDEDEDDVEFVPGSNDSTDLEEQLEEDEEGDRGGEEEDRGGEEEGRGGEVGHRGGEEGGRGGEEGHRGGEVGDRGGEVGDRGGEKREAAAVWRSKSGIAWSPTNEDTVRYRPAEIPHPGITRHAISRIANMGDYFDFFITDDILKVIVQMTNLEAQRVHGDSWKSVDIVEIRGYIGLLLLVGVFRSRGELTRSLWGEDTGRPIFRATMSEKRFNLLSRTIRFDDRLTRPTRQVHKPDKLALIRDVWSKWVARLPIAFNPGEEICVDEQLVSFRGRCGFRQYMPSKPAKYGLKLWTLCDVSTSYAWKVQPYLGKASPTRSAGEAAGQACCELLREKMALVGTIRRNKPELPPQLLDACQRQPLTSWFAFTQTITAVSYIPKRGKNVILLSTKHREASVSDAEHKKTKIVLDYNHCKGAVDNLDKLVATYSSRRMTKRWPMVLFGHILDLSAYNALVLWLGIEPTWKQAKKFRRRQFLEELGTILVTPLMSQRSRLPRTPGAVALVKGAQQTSDAAQAPDEAAAASTPRQKCHLCDSGNKCSRGCSRCGKGICKKHTVCISTLCLED
ncbi:uncharacterized protein V6R79_017929 [Siganus canaliculatus]